MRLRLLVDESGLVVGETGSGKSTLLRLIAGQAEPASGSINIAGALSVRDTDEIMLLTAKGQSIRTRVKEIRETGRGAKGVKLTTLERTVDSHVSKLRRKLEDAGTTAIQTARGEGYVFAPRAGVVT